MAFEESAEGNVRILTLGGQISDHEMSELADYVTGLIGGNDGIKVVLDLGQVRWLNSMAFGVLTALLQRLRKASGDLKLAKAHDHVISVFVQTQLRVCEEITVANIWKIKYLSGLGQPGLR